MHLPGTHPTKPALTALLPLVAAGALSLCVLLPAAAVAQDGQGSHMPAHRPAVTANHGLVTTGGNPLASMAGLRMLLAGGNAADAAVATLATLQVVEPAMSGAGGNGFFTIYDRATDRVYSLHGTGAAPLALDASEVTAGELSRGMKAGVTPGLFGAWIALLDRFGTMTLGEVLEPAIEYAADGHPIQPIVTAGIAEQAELFSEHPTTTRIFLPGGEAPGALVDVPPAGPRQDLPEPRGGRGGRAGRGQDEIGGARGRLRPLLQGRPRKGDGRLLRGARRTLHLRGLRPVRAHLGGSGPRQLPGP